MCLQYCRTYREGLQGSALTYSNATWKRLQLFAYECLPTLQEPLIMLFDAIQSDSGR
jgi:hypothetical protein